MATKYQRKGSDSWYLQWWDVTAGKQRKLCLGTITQQEAERARAIKDLELAAGVTLTLADVAKVPRSMTFGTFVNDHYKEWHRKQYPDTGDKLDAMLGVLMPEFGKLPMSDISTAIVEQWKIRRMQGTYTRGAGGTLKKYTVSITTVKRDLSQLMAILRKAIVWGHIKEIPCPHVEPCPRGDDALPKMLTKDELQRIYNADTVRADWWRFIANTGLRRGEAMKARRSDVRADSGGELVLVVESKVSQGTRTKSGKLRTIPLNEAAVAALCKLGDDYLLPRIDRTMLTRYFGRSAAKAGVDATLHALRHTFCSHLADAGIAARVIQELAGHSSLEVTQIYMHLAPGAKNLAVCKISL